MGASRFRKIVFSASALLAAHAALAQPFVDIINTSYQSLTTTYKDSLKSPNRSDNFYLNLTIPVKLDSQNTLIARFYGERLITYYQARAASPSLELNDAESSVSSALLPLGLQHETRGKRWKLLVLAMPKLSSDFADPLSAYDFQIGGYAMATYAMRENLKLKFGLFYNREAFGNFFVPIAAVDWKPCSWFQMYGVLPNNYRFEFAPWRKHIHCGLAFKSYTRSYRLSSAYARGYVRNDEIQLKAFVDVYIARKFVLFAEAGHTFGYSPLAYAYNTKEPATNAPQYTAINDAFFFNMGLAYRIRFDFN